MATRMGEPHRVVRSDTAQCFVNRKAFDIGRGDARPFLLVPSTSDDPFARPRLRRSLAHHANDVVPGASLCQLQIACGIADAGEVRVRLHDAGRRQRAVQINDLGARPDVSLHVLTGPDRRYGVAVDSHRLRLRHLIVNGDDLAVRQHEIRWSRRSGLSLRGESDARGQRCASKPGRSENAGHNKEPRNTRVMNLSPKR